MLSTTGCTRRFAWRRSGRPDCFAAQQHLLGAEHGAPEHALRATAFRCLIVAVVELLREVVLVHLHGRDGDDVLDAGLFNHLVEALGDTLVVRAQEQLEEPLELRRRDAVEEAHTAERAVLVFVHERVVHGQQPASAPECECRSDRSSPQPLQARPRLRPRGSCAASTWFPAAAAGTPDSPRRTCGPCAAVRTAGSAAGHPTPQPGRCCRRPTGSCCGSDQSRVCSPINAPVQASRTGARFDCVPRSRI